MPAEGYNSPLKIRWVTAFQNALQHRSFQNYEEWSEFFENPENSEFLPEGETKFPPKSTFYYYRKEVKPHDDLDRPWSLGQAVSDDVIAKVDADALPVIAALWYRAKAGGRTLSVRQAIWVARLRAIASRKSRTEGWAIELHSLAAKYSLREVLNEGPANTGDLDVETILNVFLNEAGPRTSSTPGLGISLGLITSSNLAFRHKLIESTDITKLPTAGSEIDDEIATDAFSLSCRSNIRIQRDNWLTLPLWKTTIAMFGIRAVAASDGDWVRTHRPLRLQDEQMTEKCAKVRDAAIDENWELFSQLIGQKIHLPTQSERA